jgi:hydroxymethylbilane synthase
MSGRQFVIGTRGSQLALWQANFVRNELKRLHPGLPVEIEIIKTTGDAVLDSPLSLIGSMGLFTKEIEQALLERRVDLAVHSLKDVPTMLPAGLMIAAVSKREDVRDVFVGHPGKPRLPIEELPAGAVIATGSLRRKCQLLSWRPDLRIVDLRGNLNTRLAKLDRSNWHGIILAKAGIVRLGAGERITQTIPEDRILPAVGQGALGIEIRDGDRETLDLVKPLNSEATLISTNGERALLRALEGGCQVPIGAYGRIESGRLLLDGMIGGLDGKKIVRGAIHGEPGESAALGEQLAVVLLKSGGKELLDRVRHPDLQEVPDS